MNKTEWLNKQYEIFQNEQWDIIMELMREVYRVAKMDSDFDNPYTELVLKNLSLITNKKEMDITFKQWKSFRAYLNVNTQLKEINIENLGM